MKARFFPVFALTICVALVGLKSSDAVIFNLEATVGGSNTAFPSSSYGFLVADTAGDGFQFLSNTALLTGARSAAENSILGADDLIFAVNLVLNAVGAGQNGFDLNQRSFNTTLANPAWETGDDFAIVWFQNGTSNVGDPFGFYRSGTLSGVSGSNVAFDTPGAGNFSLFDLSTSVPGGTTNPAAYTLQNGIIAVPEPSVILLIAFAPILLKLFRVFRIRNA